MLAPRADRILVRPDPERAIAGILLGTRAGLHPSAAQLGRTCTVMAVGPGKLGKNGKLRPLDVNVGDRVIIGEFDFPRHDGCYVIQEADIAGVVED